MYSFLKRQTWNSKYSAKPCKYIPRISHQLINKDMDVTNDEEERVDMARENLAMLW